MKTLILTLLMFLTVNVVIAQSGKQDEKVSPDEMATIVGENKIGFVPVMARSIRIDGGFWFELIGDSISAYLPFFEKNAQSGADFEDLLDINKKADKIEWGGTKKGYIANIRVKTHDDLLNIKFDVTAKSGNATLSITSNLQHSKWQSVSYMGYVYSPKEKMPKKKK